MDLRLPDGSGLEATRALRKTSATMGIVVLTMYAGDDQLFGALEAGASAFVPEDRPGRRGRRRRPARRLRAQRVHRRRPGRGDEAPARPERPAAVARARARCCACSPTA